MENWLQKENDIILLLVKAVPGASKNAFAGIRDNRLCVRVASAPEDGKANDCLRAFIADSLRCPKRDVKLIKGEKSRLKTISVPAAYEEKLMLLCAF